MTKILTRYFSKVTDEIVVETLYADIVDEKKWLYKIDNIPFFWPEFSIWDIIFAEYDKNEDFLTFRKVIKYSWNSTIQIIILKNDFDENSIIKKLEEFWCLVEKYNKKYFVFKVDKKQNYKNIFDYIFDLEKKEIISFAEHILSNKHSKEK